MCIDLCVHPRTFCKHIWRFSLKEHNFLWRQISLQNLPPPNRLPTAQAKPKNVYRLLVQGQTIPFQVQAPGRHSVRAHSS
jgi:hypothetical protein